MLIKEPKLLLGAAHPFLSLLSCGKESKELQSGIYEIPHFNGHILLGKQYENYPEFEDFAVNCYGVCDSVENLLEKIPDLQASSRKFVVTMTQVRRAEQPEEGGWRWHKWGPYIGTQDPQCEYIHDEPVVEQVYCYHIFEKLE